VIKARWQLVSIVRATRFLLLKPPRGDPFWPALYHALDETQKAANDVMTRLYLHEKARMDYRDEYGEWPDQEQVESFPEYNQWSKKYALNSRILPMLYPQNRHVPSQGGGYTGGIWKRLRNDVMRGKASLPNIRWGRVPFKAASVLTKDKQLKVEERKGDLWWPLPLDEKILFPSKGWYWVRIATRNLDGSRKEVLARLMDGTYRCGDWELHWKERRKLLEIVVTYTQPADSEETPLARDRVLGIDLGVKQTVAALANSKYPVGQAALRETVSQLIETKLHIEGRRRELLRRLSRPDVRRGHGRKAKYRPIEHLDEKWKNFRKTWNHTLSRRIVDIAVRERCGVIQREDLTGELTDTQTFLGRNWPLHELWQMIDYKAKEAGIEVRKINPAYTSRRCSECGVIDDRFTFEYRATHGMPKFRCRACGWEADADFNAARNIANPKVEEEIKKERERQERKNRSFLEE